MGGPFPASQAHLRGAGVGWGGVLGFRGLGFRVLGFWGFGGFRVLGVQMVEWKEESAFIIPGSEIVLGKSMGTAFVE